jgi:hypothetical protein
LQSSNSPQSKAVHRGTWASAIRRGLFAAAAFLTLTSTAGCMVEAMYAVPVALDTAGSAIARALPVNEKKYIVHSTRIPPGELALATAPKPVPDPALADADKFPRNLPQLSSQAPSPPAQITAAASPVPMPVLIDSALARRTRT